MEQGLDCQKKGVDAADNLPPAIFTKGSSRHLCCLRPATEASPFFRSFFQTPNNFGKDNDACRFNCFFNLNLFPPWV